MPAIPTEPTEKLIYSEDVCFTRGPLQGLISDEFLSL